MIENLLASTTKVKILRLLFEYPNRSFSTDEILKNSYSGRGYAGKCIKLFLGIGLLKMEKVGKEKRYSLNKEHEFYTTLKEIFEKEKTKYPTFSYIHRALGAELIEKLNEETIVLFGSVAAGTYTEGSDIDLLIITERKGFVKNVTKTMEKEYRVKIQAILLSMEELKKRIEEKSRLLKNIAKEYVFVFGDEKIIGMIKNV